MSTEHITRGRTTSALIIIAIGALFLLHNLDLLHIGAFIRTYWPSALILVGILNLINGRSSSGFSIVLILVGAYFQAHKLSLIAWDWHFVWPVVLIAIGLWMLLRPLTRPKRRDNSIGGSSKESVTSDTFDSFVFMSGSEKRIDSQSLRGGDVTTILGGTVIDLRNARPAGSEIQIKTTTILGGTEIYFPPEWKLDLQITPILGGVEDARRYSADASIASHGPRVVLTGTVFMGGIEIKS